MPDNERTTIARERVWRTIDNLADGLWELSLWLHEHPEVSYQEHQSAARLSEVLAQEGFQVTPGVGGLATAFWAIHPAQAEGPTVAILAEYDALPELGHACGHNLIATVAVGAALGLAAVKADLPGRLVVLGTPAEELGSGKVRLIKAGVLRGVDVAMMVHPGCKTRAEPLSLALTSVRISFKGKAAHASGHPEEGVNALDAVLQTFSGINALRQHVRDGSRIHGIITDGGQRPNIVPEHAAASFFVRSSDNAYRDELVEKLRRCAQGAATATGATLSFKVGRDECKTMRSNHALAEAFRRNIEALGYAVDTQPQDRKGSTDMGNVCWEVPSIQPEIQIADKIPGHSRDFAEASRSDRARLAMLAAAKALAAVSLEVWTDPDLYRQARDEFALGVQAGA